MVGGANARTNLLKVPGVKDNEDSPTTISAAPAQPAKGAKTAVDDAAGGILQVHKPGEGYATRLGMMAVVMAFVLFACHHWYYNWIYFRNFLAGIVSSIGLGALTDWTGNVGAQKWIAYIGSGALAVAGFLAGYYFVYVRRASAEFMIKTDGEMAKVTWPAVTPWFKVNTKVWGATYVVLIVVAIMTVYVFGVDMALQFVSNKAFYGGK
jgi:preprotein translocase subunit SecE